MYNFTRSTWTVEETEREIQRLARISDEELLRGMAAANYMCSLAAYWGERPREAYVIQRELVRLEICKRGARLSLDRLGDLREENARRAAGRDRGDHHGLGIESPLRLLLHSLQLRSKADA